MPEGDTVHRAARRLAEALESRAVLRSDVRVPQHATVDLSGEVVDSVVARGKHLLMRIGPSVVHSHLKMEGSWHVYRPGTRWRRPAFEARMVLDVAPGGGDAHGWQAVGFALGELDIVPRDREEELGPSVSPCSTSASSPASATTTATRRSSCAASFPSAPWARWMLRPRSIWRCASSAPTATAVSARRRATRVEGVASGSRTATGNPAVGVEPPCSGEPSARTP